MILDAILSSKRDELVRLKREKPLSSLKEQARKQPPPRSLVRAVRQGAPLAIIAEIKKASPSAGAMRVDFDLLHLARTYHESRADAISVVTDGPFFQGDPCFIDDIRSVSDKPILRKDFIVDPYQVVEARAHGADAILLIASILTERCLREMIYLVRSWGMEALVETHNAAEIQAALALGANLVGINNRDLGDFHVDISTTLRLAPLVPPNVTLVSESGIQSRADAQRLQEAGVHGILVGTSLLRSRDIPRKIADLVEW